MEYPALVAGVPFPLTVRALGYLPPFLLVYPHKIFFLDYKGEEDNVLKYKRKKEINDK
jgi:hypothetical protein